MSLDLTNYEENARRAVQHFWCNRTAAIMKQQQRGISDTGARGAVTAGKNMDGFISLVHDIVAANGLAFADISVEKRAITLPGYFRPTKQWDMLVTYRGELIAALEFKSHVGPSFGNNFNNRAEEAIGTAHDLWTAYREGAFGKDVPRPFLGWLVLVEDCSSSRKPVKYSEPHFNIFPEFKDASCVKRYDFLSKRLVQEGLYGSSCLLLSPKSAVDDGGFSHVSEMTSLKTFVTQLAGHVAAVAAR